MTVDVMAQGATDPETQLDVDEMIVDFLAYDATGRILSDLSARNDSNAPTELNLSSVDCFMEYFNEAHRPEDVSRAVRLRIQALQFIALYSESRHRSVSSLSTESLAQLRSSNARRAERWYSRASREKESAEIQQIASKYGNGNGNGDDVSISDSDPTLRDILPLFMTLSAASVDSEPELAITQTWMDLAGQFILHAVLEHHVSQFQGSLLQEAFAWGLDEHDEGSLNAFFDGSGEDGVRQWEATKGRYLAMLDSSHSDPKEHLLSLSRQYARSDFEESLLEFLEGIANMHPAPILVQLQQGQLEGLTREETADFKRRVGLDS